MGLRRRLRSLPVAVTLGLLAGAVPQATSAAPPTLTTTVIASGLSIPWDVAFLPNGQMLVTERAGRVRVYDGGIAGAALLGTITIPNVRAQGEAGLMGIAVDVDYGSNPYVYVCASRDYAGSGGWRNQVLRYQIASTSQWINETILIGTMAANTIHNGCALEMDRFGKLWVTMGDAANQPSAQNRNSLNGKILRINRDGSTPSDNPVIQGARNQVYSMGHRNPQGIAFRPGTDQVYAAEHGPDRDDEINLIVPGGNYGWPCYTGNGVPHNTTGCGPAGNYLAPLWASGTPTIATSGAAFAGGAQWADFNGQLWVAQLKESDMRRWSLNGPGTSLTGPTTHFNNAWGRLRGVTAGPGGQLYVTTSNGSNDQVIRISPATPVVERIAGPDRYGTAAGLSQAADPAGAINVMVATGTNFPDALAGSAAAGRLGMPVLLVQPDAIPAVTAAELDRLNAQRIYLVGGPGAVSESVRTALAAYASTGDVPRIWGADRAATAAAVSATWYAPGVAAAFVAVGSNFPDALAGAPAAALNNSPLLLVSRDGVPAPTANELDRLNPQRIFVLGGSGVIGNGVVAQLDTYTDGPVVRLGGVDRYHTAAIVAQAFWLRSSAFVATGLNFPDALAGGAVAGRLGVPMLLTRSNTVPPQTGQEVLRLASLRVTLLGGTGVIPPGVETIFQRLVGGP